MKVLTFGVFDILHRGHVRLFERAKQLGDCLIVAVQIDEKILQYKPGTKIINNTDQRIYMVRAIRYVDEVVTYDDVDKAITKMDFDVLALGEDQNHEGFKKAILWCQNHNKKVVIITRTPDISSSYLKENIK